MTERGKRRLPNATTRFWAGKEPGTRRNPFDRCSAEEKSPKSA